MLAAAPIFIYMIYAVCGLYPNLTHYPHFVFFFFLYSRRWRYSRLGADSACSAPELNLKVLCSY